jgi:hypothetical protein
MIATAIKKNLARSIAATVLSCLCLVVVCSLAAATTPVDEFQLETREAPANRAHASASSDASDAQEGQSPWNQQSPKVALLESRSVPTLSSLDASAADGVSDKTNNSNNNNLNNNNLNNLLQAQHASNNLLCRPSMALMCRPLLAAQEMEAGQVCVSVQDGQMSVQVKANDLWTLLEASVWMAKVAAAGTTTTVPIVQGRVDHEAFKIQSKPDMRSASWEATMASTTDCTASSFSSGEEEQTKEATMVVRVLVAEVNDQGTLIPGTEETAFAYGQVASASANYEEDSIYGFLELTLLCPCTTTAQNLHQGETPQDWITETHVARRLDASSLSSLSLFSSVANQRRLAYSASETAFHRRLDASGQHHRVLQTQVEEECFSAFAYYEQEGSSSSTCLDTLGYKLTGTQDESGWTNGPFPSSFVPYQMKLYTDAPNCNASEAKELGVVTVLLDGEEATVTFNLDPAGKFFLKDTAVYAGLDKLPPAQNALPAQHASLTQGGNLTLQDTLVVDNFDLGDQVHVVAHATVCRAPPKIYVPGISKPCLPTRSHSGKECYPLLAGPTIDAGQVCIEVVPEQDGPNNATSHVLKVTFSTFGDWVLDHASFWLGSNLTQVPTIDGAVGSLPDEHKFPYFYCNFTGATTWETTVALNLTTHCFEQEDFTLTMVARSEVVQQDYEGAEIDGSKAIAFAFEHPGHEGEVVPDDEWFAFVDFKINCDCSAKLPDGKGGAKLPVCVETQDGSGRECVPLVIDQTEEAGSVCVKVVGSDKPVLELTYHTSPHYSLIQNHFWVGVSSLEELPVLGNGSPDVDLFPYYWCDYAGG